MTDREQVWVPALFALASGVEAGFNHDGPIVTLVWAAGIGSLSFWLNRELLPSVHETSKTGRQILTLTGCLSVVAIWALQVLAAAVIQVLGYYPAAWLHPVWTS